VAITPPSDIVLDVARAADPEKYRVAAERLARLRAAASAPSATAEFGALTTPTTPTVATPAPAGNPPDAGGRTQSRSRLNAYGQFEAFVLQSFIQSMLPHNATNVFGKGSAGAFWRSMLAEKMGNELARSGQVGIARRLAAGPQPASQSTVGATPNPRAPPPSLLTTLRNGQPPAAEPVPAADPLVPATPAAGERS
jgi:peptidoglycan hydrolase FlgJ